MVEVHLAYGIRQWLRMKHDITLTDLTNADIVRRMEGHFSGIIHRTGPPADDQTLGIQRHK